MSLAGKSYGSEAVIGYDVRAALAGIVTGLRADSLASERGGEELLDHLADLSEGRIYNGGL